MIVSAFIFNLFCGFFSCDVRFDIPEIKKTGDIEIPEIGARTGYNAPRDYLESKVIVKSGALEGYFGATMGGRKIYTFEGIPYAEPPVGYYRWKVSSFFLNSRY